MAEQPQSILEQLRRLELPEKSYMVMGSGILDVLGIRPANDIDMVVSGEVYAQLKAAGWEERTASNGSTGLEHESFQVYDRWTDEKNEVKTLDELLVDAQWEQNVAFNSLAKLSSYKLRRGLQKDIDDLGLIAQYLATSNKPS